VHVFLQSEYDSIVINDEITVTVLKIEDDEIFLEVDAPDWLSVEESAPAPPRRGRTAAGLPAR
jgi:sRNA-binding carbon storage regulator CsrA